jgi:ABC-2 type transport system ATP-binding protein
MSLSEWSAKKVQALSKGMAQKVQFIAAVIAQPELVLLDEPFTGLDPVNMEVLREAVLDLRRQGTTIIFSTHDMGVAERMCDRIFMIYKGRKVLDGTLESIQATYGADTVRVRLDRDGDSLAQLPGISGTRDFGKYQELRLEDRADTQRVLAALMARGRVEQFEVTRPSLHDIFVRIAAPDAEEAAHA